MHPYYMYIGKPGCDCILFACRYLERCVTSVLEFSGNTWHLRELFLICIFNNSLSPAYTQRPKDITAIWKAVMHSVQIRCLWLHLHTILGHYWNHQMSFSRGTPTFVHLYCVLGQNHNPIIIWYHRMHLYSILSGVKQESVCFLSF